MALTENQQLFAMYVIGEVESNWDWTGVYYVDPITIGMMQWYGTRAAGLLNRIKKEDEEGYKLLASSLRSSLDSYGASNAYWNTRYLSQTEGASWQKCADRDENHVIQQNQFFEDLDNYVGVLTGWGCKIDTPEHVKAFIFCCVMYHQGPLYAGQVIRGVGGTDLERLHSGVLNNGVLGQYTNRYNTAYNRLSKWDGESAPPDFGQVGGGPGGGNGHTGSNSGTGTEQINSQIKYIRANGSQLIVYGKDNENGLICYKSANGFWYPQRNSAAPDSPSKGDTSGSDSAGGGPASTDEIDKMIAWYKSHENDWYYSQGAGRLDPESSGYSDCSASIWAAINSVNPTKAKSIGTWTGAMRNNGKEIAKGVGGESVDISKLRKGDILLIEWGYVNYNFDDGSSHVEWYVGDGELWGAGSAPLPHKSGNINKYIGPGMGVGCWMVRRIL